MSTPGASQLGGESYADRRGHRFPARIAINPPRSLPKTSPGQSHEMVALLAWPRRGIGRMLPGGHYPREGHTGLKLAPSASNRLAD
jgi:hypothetical protein